MIFNLFKPNDWVVIKSETSTYDTHQVYIQSGREFKSESQPKTCRCTLLYSTSRNKYKIKISGFHPQDMEGCSAYRKCLEAKISKTNKI